MISTLSKKQKTGIALLIIAKALERLAFYSIMAILAMYFTDVFDLEAEEALWYYSGFYGVVGFATLISGFIGDLQNRAKIVFLGFILVTAMFVSIAVLPIAGFVLIIAFVLLGFGIGLITPNIIVLLGNIYNEKETEIRGWSGFILFTIATNIGAFYAALVSASLKNDFGYNTVFLFAAISGFIAMLLFFWFNKIYNSLHLTAEQKDHQNSAPVKKLHNIILLYILVTIVLSAFAIYQKPLSVNWLIREFSGNIPNIQQMLSSIASLTTTLVVILFTATILLMKHLNWRKVLNTILIGLVSAIFGFMIITAISISPGLISRNSLLIPSYIFIGIAETLIFPTFTYAIYRSSPIEYKGLFQGILFFVVALANQLLALGTAIYERSTTLAMVIITVVLIVSAFLFIKLKKTVNRWLYIIDHEKAKNFTTQNNSSVSDNNLE